MTTFDDTTASSLDQQEVEDQQEYEERGQFHLRGIKFFGGEEVVCAVHENDTDWTMRKHIVMYDPMVYDSLGYFQPWARTADESGHTIQTANILSMYEIHDSIATKYTEAGKKNAIALLREDLKDPDLTDEEREQIERDIYEMIDSDETIDLPEPPEMFRYLEVPKSVH
jgi:hypothetical protein